MARPGIVSYTILVDQVFHRHVGHDAEDLQIVSDSVSSTVIHSQQQAY